MAIRSLTARQVLSGQQQVSQSTTVPAPWKGIDSRTVLSAGEPEYAIYAFNLLPNEYGLRVRRGYREWAINLDNGSGLHVGTIIPFGSDDTDQTNDRLFAVTNEGIWDVTTENDVAPALVLDFSVAPNGENISAEAGWGVYTQYTTDAEEKVLYYADSINGLFIYDPGTDSWARATGITNAVGAPVTLDLTKVNFVMNYKDFIWLVEQDKSYGWYLPNGSITGEAEPFFFGGNFDHGGDLAGLYNWTVDGGAGVDDILVAVSRAGDVLPYQGTNPASATDWNLIGKYFIGAVPTGGRFADSEGGNLNLLSIYGLISMNDLLQGVDPAMLGSKTETQRIAAIIRQAMRTTRLDDGWQVKNLPSIGSLSIAAPPDVNGTYIQFVFHYTTQGWGLWRDLPITAIDEWDGEIYFGSLGLKVYVMDVDVDDAKITPPVNETNGDAINWAILTTFQNYGFPSLFKRGKYCRPQFVSQGTPNVTVRFRYDYDLSEVINSEGALLNTDALWDVGLWDVALWSTTRGAGFNPVRGGWGIGRNIAIAMSGNSRSETTLISWDVVWDVGAPL